MIGKKNQRAAPLFIIGSPRSGTTLLRLILTSHPQLTIPPECGFIIQLLPRFSNWGQEEFSDDHNAFIFAQAIAKSRKFETWNVGADTIQEAILAHKPASYSQACAIVYELFCQAKCRRTEMWGDKNNFYLNYITVLNELYPKARFLHIVRDGRDVACSYREVMNNKKNNHSNYYPSLPRHIDGVAKQWVHDVQAIQNQMAAIKNSHKLEVRYEDLTANPEDELSDICKWLHLSFTPEMLNFYQRNTDNNLEPPVTMDWKIRTREPINQSTVGRYARCLNAVEIEKFTNIAYPTLTAYGYCI